jgi:rhodanese-related sulfurtransferase
MSEEFHHELSVEADKSGADLLVFVPDSTPDSQQLAKTITAGTSAKSVNWSAASHRFRGTPSVAFISSDSVIKRVWLGKLVPEAESELLQAVRMNDAYPMALPDFLPGVRNFTMKQAVEAPLTSSTIIDVRGRLDFEQSHVAGAVNIPIHEVRMRAPQELSKRASYLVDCSILSRAECLLVVDTLKSAEFRVGVIEAGRQ